MAILCILLHFSYTIFTCFVSSELTIINYIKTTLLCFNYLFIISIIFVKNALGWLFFVIFFFKGGFT